MVPMGPIFMQATAMINCQDNHLKTQYKNNILETLSFLFLWLQPWGKVLCTLTWRITELRLRNIWKVEGYDSERRAPEKIIPPVNIHTHTHKHTPHTPCQPLSHICPPQTQANTEQSVSTYTLTLRIRPESRKHVKDHLQYSRHTPELLQNCLTSKWDLWCIFKRKWPHTDSEMMQRPRLVNEDSKAVTKAVLSTQGNAFIIDAKRKSQQRQENAIFF